MIPACRIRQLRRRLALLSFAFVFTACLLTPFTQATGQYAEGSSEDTGAILPLPVPLRFTAGVELGYDDNVRGGGAGGGGASAGESVFARESLTLSYERKTKRTEVSLVAVGRFTQFFDLGTDDKDGNISLSLAHGISTRLALYSSVYAAYQTEPDFTSNVGLENVRADHFYTNDIFAVTYRWLPRLATIASYAFKRVQYFEESQDEESQNRVENTFGERLQFSLTRRTSLLGEYRFQIVDYDSAPRDSTTHFALAGIDHSLTEHLSLNLLGGESFRSFKDDGDTINPYVYGKLAYEGSNHTLAWIASYGVEEPSAVAARSRTTIRTGVNLAYDLTSRITARTAIHYHHDDNEGQPGTQSVGSQDSVHFTVGLKYTINKHFALHLDYEHTAVSTLGTESGYSRNRYSGGVTYTY
jgi:Putative beta-barrel porin 2